MKKNQFYIVRSAIALLTAKPLTEGLVRGNNFECIESFLSFRDEVMYKKGKEYKCDVDGMLRNEHGTLDNLDKTLLNRHFKLLPTTQEESVKGEVEIALGFTTCKELTEECDRIRNMEFFKLIKSNTELGSKLTDKTIETAHLQQQLKEAKEEIESLRRTIGTMLIEEQNQNVNQPIPNRQPMKTAEIFLKERGLKDSIYDVANPIPDQWIKGGLSKLLEDYASSRSMESQWISVEDKKPEIGVIVNLVLKHSKEDVYSGFRANGGWYCFQVGENPKHYIPNGIENVKITHWQPLPQPPTK